jgi:hypothetical protein
MSVATKSGFKKAYSRFYKGELKYSGKTKTMNGCNFIEKDNFDLEAFKKFVEPYVLATKDNKEYVRQQIVESRSVRGMIFRLMLQNAEQSQFSGFYTHDEKAWEEHVIAYYGGICPIHGKQY